MSQFGLTSELTSELEYCLPSASLKPMLDCYRGTWSRLRYWWSSRCQHHKRGRSEDVAMIEPNSSSWRRRQEAAVLDDQRSPGALDVTEEMSGSLNGHDCQASCSWCNSSSQKSRITKGLAKAGDGFPRTAPWNRFCRRECNQYLTLFGPDGGHGFRWQSSLD